MELSAGHKCRDWEQQRRGNGSWNIHCHKYREVRSPLPVYDVKGSIIILYDDLRIDICVV